MNHVEHAIEFALHAHAGMVRKGKNIPYILHPLEVMTIAAGLTHDEDILAAAVLHDTVEDTDTTLADIEREFGKRTALLVAMESENKRGDLPASQTWQIRKQETIDLLKTAGRDMKLVCLCDKLANLRELERDLKEFGDPIWDRFNQKDKTKQRWYYGSILEILEKEFPDAPEIEEYRERLAAIFGA